jgi:two-component system chemotaxis response regulator CheY
MVVDDALFMRNMLKDIFVRAGHDVVAEAENGEIALELYQEVNPDLVTMDIVMPKKSGIEALQDIMALDASACVVMVSALGQDSLLKQLNPEQKILSSNRSRKRRSSRSSIG